MCRLQICCTCLSADGQATWLQQSQESIWVQVQCIVQAADVLHMLVCPTTSLLGDNHKRVSGCRCHAPCRLQMCCKCLLAQNHAYWVTAITGQGIWVYMSCLGQAAYVLHKLGCPRTSRQVTANTSEHVSPALCRLQMCCTCLLFHCQAYWLTTITRGHLGAYVMAWATRLLSS